MRQIRMLSLFTFLLMALSSSAQETFIIEGDTLQLQEEVSGPLSLYWQEKDHNYRYFVQKGNELVELRNERVDGEKKRRYQLQLDELTRDVKIFTGDVRFVLYSLRHFVNQYNAKVQEDYVYNAATPNVQQRAALMVGLSNNRYAANPDNLFVPVLGVEYELHDPNLAPRHSAFLQLRHSFQRQNYNYSSTQLSLNYRFKFLYFSGFDVHLDTELATFYHSETSLNITNDAGEVVRVEEESGFSFTAPLSFGVGADIKVNERGSITLGYNDFVSLVLNSNGSFPLDFTVGYRYNL